VITARFWGRLPEYASLLGRPGIDAVGRIREYFPSDIGTFAPLVLNTVVAEPGFALFIPAGTLHAYLDGDLYEAMAMSDNVVRAAMTPKFVDVETLLQMLNFWPRQPQWVEGKQVRPGIVKFVPPSSEFLLYQLKAKAGEKVAIGPFAHEAIASVLHGRAVVNGGSCQGGEVLLYLAGQTTVVEAETETVVTIASYESPS
jgi:mannose-6-phosphate isomerase